MRNLKNEKALVSSEREAAHVLGVVNVLVLAVLHPDPPGLDAAVDAVAPLEGGREQQRDAQDATRDGLDGRMDADDNK